MPLTTNQSCAHPHASISVCSAQPLSSLNTILLVLPQRVYGVEKMLARIYLRRRNSAFVPRCILERIYGRRSPLARGVSPRARARASIGAQVRIRVIPFPDCERARALIGGVRSATPMLRERLRCVTSVDPGGGCCEILLRKFAYAVVVGGARKIIGFLRLVYI